MKSILTVLLALGSLSALGQSLDCKSKTYRVVTVKTEAGGYLANYQVNGENNEGADVIVDHALLTSQVAAVTIAVDGQKNMIKIAAMRMALPGKLQGTIMFGQTTETALCTFKRD